MQEVQAITVSKASGNGYFFVELNTNATGGSQQYSGYIYDSYPADDSSGITFGANVASIISSMANIKSNGAVQVTRNTIDAQTYNYLVTFPASMGNVPQMIVHTTELTPVGQASAAVTTPIQGNVIAGTFTLTYQGETTVAIKSDATENDVRVALEALSGIESVAITRSAVDYQHGYSWTIDFNSALNAGNVQTLSADPSKLTTSNTAHAPHIAVSSINGNQLGGTFNIVFTHGGQTQTSDNINFDASAADFKSALEGMPNNIIPAGTVAVTRTGPDPQLGYSWTVTFLSDYARTFEGELLFHCVLLRALLFFFCFCLFMLFVVSYTSRRCTNFIIIIYFLKAT